MAQSAKKMICVMCGEAFEGPSYCPNCNSDKFCSEKDVVECSDCDKMNLPTAKKCIHCGAVFDDEEVIVVSKRTKEREEKSTDILATVLIVAIGLGLSVVSLFYRGILGTILSGMIWTATLLYLGFLAIRGIIRWVKEV